MARFIKKESDGTVSEYLIKDSDVQSTDGKNKTIKEKFEESDKKIDRLNANIKWMYRYGALGSGGNRSSSSTSKISLFVYKDETPVSPGSELIYDSPGLKSILFELHGGGTDTFKLTVSYGSGYKVTEILSADNSFSVTKSLNFTENDTMTVTLMNQSTFEYYTYNGSEILTYDYIVNAFVFDWYYVKGHDAESAASLNSKFIPVNHSIFMSNVKSTGLMICFDWNIAVDINDNSCSISYTDWEGTQRTLSNDSLGIASRSSGKIYLPLAEDIIAFLSDNSNAKYYSVNPCFTFTLSGNTEAEDPVYPDTAFNDNLIPDGLYLKVTSNAGVLCSTESAAEGLSDDEKILQGDVIFNVTPYSGSYDETKTYSLKINLYEVSDTGEETLSSESGDQSLSDQKEESVSVSCISTGIKRVEFSLTLDSEVFTISYYISIKELEKTLDFYTDSVSISNAAYYRKNLEVKNMSLYDGSDLSAASSIYMTVNSSPVTYKFNLNDIGTGTDGTSSLDQFLNIGIQYSKINDNSQPICSFNKINSTSAIVKENSIVIYQNKIVITKAEKDISSGDYSFAESKKREIFIPLENDYSILDSSKFSLLSIYKRLENISGSNYYKGVYCYVNGILDGIFSSFDTANYAFDSVTFYPGNYSINLIENTMLDHASLDSASVTWLEDTDILRYYKAFNEKLVLRESYYTDNQNALLSLFSQFTYDDENHVIVPSKDLIANIAKLSQCPVMLINHNDGGGKSIQGFTGYDSNNFLRWMDYSDYEENDETATQKIPVTIEWSSGLDQDSSSELKTVGIDGSSGDTFFRLDIQGSSTRKNRAKNFEIYAPASSSEDTVYVYSPNNDPDASDTDAFLPEESFTFKADVVDSGHSNNNVIGKFINKCTTPFAASRQASTGTEYLYSERIKNCLEGFPLLMFLHTVYPVSESSSENKEAYYFLGIYNCNLGRNSAFNLGYKDVKVFDNVLPDSSKGFQIFSISSNDNGIISTFMGSEIQGNNHYFDFSQYSNDTLLFDSNIGMWGDFMYGSSEDSLKNSLKTLLQYIALSGGYVFESIGKDLIEDNNYGYDDAYTVENQVPNYKYQVTSMVQNGTEWTRTFTTSDSYKGTLDNLVSCISSLEQEDGSFNIPKIDFVSLAEYYAVCMAFGLVDSVQKNLNVKSWNSGDTFYFAFYDMDTGLGLNNAGGNSSYFAFSDYWDYQFTLDDGSSDIGTLSQVTIKRDYTPPQNVSDDLNLTFFDTPSSFAFAIVKYSVALLSSLTGYDSLLDSIKNYDPCNIWARWRNSTENSTSSFPGYGALRNADYFMETYFNDYLNSVPEEAFNYDYRYKYMIKNSDLTGFSERDFGNFHGNRKAYIRDWINGRIHICDAYFNINNKVQDTIYKNIKASNALDTFVPTDNEDVYMLHEIFSTGNNLQYSSGTVGGTVILKALPYSPLIFCTANTFTRYLFPLKEYYCRIPVNYSGVQTGVWYGSQAWEYIGDVSQFFNYGSTSLTIDSQNLNYMSGVKGTRDTFNLDIPSISKLILASKNYSGTLSFDSQDSNPEYMSLNYIDISNSSIELSLNNLSITTVKAENVNVKTLSITNCDNLSSECKFSGTMSSAFISNTWQQDITLDSSLQTPKIELNNYLSKVSGTKKFDNASVTISGNDLLSSVTLKGFETISISACPNISSIIISDPETVKSLSIAFSNYNETDFTVNGVSISSLDLSAFTSLSYISFPNANIVNLTLPDAEISLSQGCFSGCKDLKTITGEGKYYITDSNTFYNCQAFTLKKYDESADNGLSAEIANIYVSSSCTSLASTFNINDRSLDIGSIELSAASQFLLERCKNTSGSDGVENVTSIDMMFGRQNISYSTDEGLNDYVYEQCLLPLGGFINVSSIENVFYGTNVIFFPKYMFKMSKFNDASVSGFDNGLGSNVTDISFNINTAGIKIFMYDTFEYIISKMSAFYDLEQPILVYEEKEDSTGDLTVSYTHNGVTYYFGLAEEVKINDLFTPNGLTPDNLHIFSGIKFSTSFTLKLSDSSSKTIPITLDATDLFDHAYSSDDTAKDNWNKDLNYVFDNAFNSISASSFKSFQKLLSKINVVSFKNSFNDMVSSADKETAGIDDIKIDLYNFFDYDTFFSNITSFNSFTDNSHYTVWNSPKYISYDNFHSLFEKLLSNSISLCSGLFMNSDIILNASSEASDIRLVSDSFSSNKKVITGLPFLLYGCYFTVGTSGEEDSKVPVAFSQSTFAPVKTCVNFYNAFSGMHFLKGFPLNLFSKKSFKQQANTEDKYYAEDITAKYDYYYNLVYSNQITNAALMFSDITFSDVTTAGFDPDDSFNSSEITSPYYTYLADGVESAPQYYYYTYSDSVFTKHSVETGVQQDIDFYNSDDYATPLFRTIIMNNKTLYSDAFSSLNGDSTEYSKVKYIISPDFFYNLADSCDITGMFKSDISDESLIKPVGTLPKHLVQVYNQNTEKSLGTAFYGCNVIPVKVYYSETVSGTVTVRDDYFSLVPSGFHVKNTMCSEEFNFNIIFPFFSDSAVQHFYLMMSDSFSDISLFSNSLPIDIYNKIGEISKFGALSNSSTSAVRYNVMLTLNKDDSGNVESIEEGFNMAKFKNVILNNAFSPLIMTIYYGDLFAEMSEFDDSYITAGYLISSSCSVSSNARLNMGLTNSKKYFPDLTNAEITSPVNKVKAASLINYSSSQASEWAANYPNLSIE